jgi:hypothetical protein
MQETSTSLTAECAMHTIPASACGAHGRLRSALICRDRQTAPTCDYDNAPANICFGQMNPNTFSRITPTIGTPAAHSKIGLNIVISLRFSLASRGLIMGQAAAVALTFVVASLLRSRSVSSSSFKVAFRSADASLSPSSSAHERRAPYRAIS